jgi:hypothetical protein
MALESTLIGWSSYRLKHIHSPIMQRFFERLATNFMTNLFGAGQDICINGCFGTSVTFWPCTEYCTNFAWIIIHLGRNVSISIKRRPSALNVIRQNPVRRRFIYHIAPLRATMSACRSTLLHFQLLYFIFPPTNFFGFKITFSIHCLTSICIVAMWNRWSALWSVTCLSQKLQCSLFLASFFISKERLTYVIIFVCSLPNNFRNKGHMFMTLGTDIMPHVTTAYE